MIKQIVKREQSVSGPYQHKSRPDFANETDGFGQFTIVAQMIVLVMENTLLEQIDTSSKSAYPQMSPAVFHNAVHIVVTQALGVVVVVLVAAELVIVRAISEFQTIQAARFAAYPNTLI